MNFKKMASSFRNRLSKAPATDRLFQSDSHEGDNSSDSGTQAEEPEAHLPHLRVAPPQIQIEDQTERHNFSLGETIARDSAPSIATPPPPAPVPEAVMTLHELQEIFAGSEWSKLMRNARDGGATSILACRILEKTMVLLEHGYKQVELMMIAAQDVRTTSDQLSSVSEDIKLVSNQTRIVSINASIEARRAGEHGRAFHVVAQEMTNLSDDARQLTQSIDVKLNGVNEKIAVNRELCLKVGRLFTNMNKELDEFRRLMMRVEQLSGIQVEQLGTIEKRLTTFDKE